MQYFSDTERPPKARQEDALTPEAWGGVVALVRSLLSSGAFGAQFPEICPDGAGTIGVNETSFELALKAEVPAIDWPLRTTTNNPDGWEPISYAPDTLTALDFIQFCYENVAKPIDVRYHEFFRHTHLSFDVETGREEFRSKINRIFQRNSVAVELLEQGDIIRLANPVLREAMSGASFETSDSILDGMLQESVAKFLNPNPQTRKEGVERLWDAWERLKSLEEPSNKKHAIEILLDKAAPEKNFRELIEAEAKALTSIGNAFRIRHSEVSQTEIESPIHLDYLFHRLFSFIQMLLSARA